VSEHKPTRIPSKAIIRKSVTERTAQLPAK
jgi:hypothetical protein